MASSAIGNLITRYPISGSDIVERVDYIENEGKIRINKMQYFEGISRDIWEFNIGGYQVSKKWLQDRKGRKLTYDELVHYQHVIAALSATKQLMSDIDDIIPGWPLE